MTGAGRDWGDHGMVCCRGSWYEVGKGKQSKPLGRGRAGARGGRGAGGGRWQAQGHSSGVEVGIRVTGKQNDRQDRRYGQTGAGRCHQTGDLGWGHRESPGQGTERHRPAPSFSSHMESLDLVSPDSEDGSTLDISLLFPLKLAQEL